MLLGNRPIIDIVYKYNVQKFPYFVATENAGRTKPGITSLSKYHNMFVNVSIHPLDFPLALSKFFGYVS